MFLLCFKIKGTFWYLFDAEYFMKKVPLNTCAGGPAYYVLHPQKGMYNREGIISRKILTEGLQILVF